jgi:hypothetical protein
MKSNGRNLLALCAQEPLCAAGRGGLWRFEVPNRHTDISMIPLHRRPACGGCGGLLLFSLKKKK